MALAIFSVLMTAVAMIFLGSLRSSRTAYQQMEAFERARASLTALKEDLISCYATQQSGDTSNFYGTPIGMTFIGTAQSTSNPNDVHMARITYVVYNCWQDDAGCPDAFPSALECEAEPNCCRQGTRPGYPYPLLRYVEPDVASLDALPLIYNEGDEFNLKLVSKGLDTELPDAVKSLAEAQTYGELVYRLFYNEGGDLSKNWDSPILTQEEREHYRAKMYEMWIRMLAGGDLRLSIDGSVARDFQGKPIGIPVNYWRDLLPLLLVKQYGFSLEVARSRAVPGNFVLTENVLSTLPPDLQHRLLDDEQSGACIDNRASNPFGGTPFFDYDYNFQERPTEPQCTRLSDGGAQFKEWNPWWNDGYGHSLNCTRTKDWRNPCLTTPYTQDLTGSVYCDDPRLPEVVTITFWLMFESKTYGSPDFKRLFSLQVNLPTGFKRKSG